MPRSYPRDKATAHRILTVHLSFHYEQLWKAEAEDDREFRVIADLYIRGFLTAAEALGLDRKHLARMAQRFNTLSVTEIQNEYGDIIAKDAEFLASASDSDEAGFDSRDPGYLLRSIGRYDFQNQNGSGEIPENCDAALAEQVAEAQG